MNIDDYLLRDAKRHAVDAGTTLGRLIELGLRLAIGQPTAEPQAPNLPVVTGTHPPGVNVANRDALYDAMDGVG